MAKIQSREKELYGLISSRSSDLFKVVILRIRSKFCVTNKVLE